MLYYGLLLVFLLEYVRPGSYLPILNVIRLNSFVPLIVIIATAFATKHVTPNDEILRETNSKLIIALIGLITISGLVWADNRFYAFQVFTTVLGYGLFYWTLCRQITDLRRIKGMFGVLIVVHLILAALTPEMFTDPDARHYLASGTFLGDGNDYALSVCIVVPMCLFLAADARSKIARLGWGAALLVCVLCIVLTQSRGGTIGLAAVGLHYWSKSNKKVITAALAAVAVAMVLMLAPGSYFTRMNKLTNYEEDGSATGRINAWRAGLNMALYNPLLGVGVGQFPANHPRFAPIGEDGPEQRWKTAHSIWFLILGELGFPGLVVLAWLIVANLATNRRIVKELRQRAGPPPPELGALLALSSSVLAYAVAGTFLSATYYPHLFVLSALTVAARRIVREQSSVVGAAVAAPTQMIYHPAMRKVLEGR
jgi:putative inorganic carbon (hco3(-)) transporter